MKLLCFWLLSVSASLSMLCVTVWQILSMRYGSCEAKLYNNAADAIEELLQKEKFHAFLWNVINPNDMQLYLEMYHSGDEKEKTE